VERRKGRAKEDRGGQGGGREVLRKALIGRYVFDVIYDISSGRLLLLAVRVDGN